MKKDITYEQRVFTNRIVDVDSMSVGNFTSKNIKELSQKDKIDGRFFHTSDTDEWFFCWKGELQKLNLKGATLKDVKELIGKTEVLIENAKNTAESAIESLGNKADKSVVDALSTKVDAIKLDEYATTSQVDERVAALVDGAPETLDTLNELSAALKDNADIVDLLTNSISVKQDKIDDLETIRSGANLGATALQVVPDEYVTETELEGMGYATTAQVDAKVDKDELKDYALKTDIKDPITYTAGDNIKIENNVVSALIPSLEEYYTKSETNAAITEELKDYALKTDIPSTLEFTKINSNNNLVKDSSIVTQLTIGSSLVSPNDNCLTVGRFNNAQTSWDAMLWVGSGSSESNRKNQMIVQENQLHYRGELKEASGWIGDFGEYFEWYDGNPNNDDRVGYMVQLNENKIEYSTSFENCIGIISDTCIITGGCCSFEWHNMYLRDEFGRELKDENGESILNPDYNPEMQYVSRDKRKEWGKVGILGQIYTRQDGTLKVGRFAGCKDGIATDAESGYRVLKIINENVALLLVK